MDTSFESKLKEALKNAEALKTPTCPDTATIGLYIEDKLPKAEAIRIEAHISSCLYCLDQVSELKELLYYQKKWTTIPCHLLTKLENIYLERKKSEKKSSRGFINLFVGLIASFIAFPFRQWRYVTVSIVSICAVLLFSSVNDINLMGMIRFLTPKSEMAGLPELNLNAFVNVKALDNNGIMIKDTQGVIIDSQGTVAANLSPLAGATSVQVTLRDGKSYQIKSIWKDDGKNIALMKIGGESLPSFKVADLKQVNIGERVFIITDLSKLKEGTGEAVISDFKPYAGSRSGGEVQYIQLVSFTSQYTRGALVDKEGRLIGLTITDEKNINLAAPLKEAFRLIKDGQPIAINELKNVNFSAGALNLYLKGILARNAQGQDEAIGLFKKAIELNPNLESAHIELGFLYYKKRLFDLERKEYEEALKINPNNTDTLFYLATNLETMGQYDEATKVFEKIVTLDPEDADAYYELGLAYLAQGQRAKAIDARDKLQKLDPGLAGKLRRIVKSEK
ncbi:MAG: tetratricopeptide repeat protein [Proteobacteria bacterium]|nr:tetratricopeptide repeat protein [Pseudomonadota bacterium]